MKVKWSNSDRQMSEAFITCVFLALSGGFQDAYTYFVRDGVFSNAQTGNVVLMSQSFFKMCIRDRATSAGRADFDESVSDTGGSGSDRSGD